MPTVALPTHELAYETRGDGPPVLLIGGTGEPMIAWEFSGLVDALVAAGHQVIWYAARGVAPSGCPPLPWSVTSMAEDASALLDHVGITTCTAIGYSLGGWTLEELVRREPQRITRAVLLASAGSPADATIRDAWTAADHAFVDAGGRIPEEFTRLMTLMTSLGGPELSDPALVAEWWELLGDQQEQWTGEGELGQAQVAKSWIEAGGTTGAPWPGVPAALVHFEHDPLYPPAGAEAVAAHLGGAEVQIVPGTGHAGLFNQAEATVAALLRAVASS
ncbi:alpha/beta fold hydrolase [Nocardioides marmorisolisilvae]|uniref:Alpha/beta hydrolase n=1 Tax=Nocardioides marmorisolisilvae TaxID=1542737 RepID=A0A3N0DRI7_9ACTN|nr:alpha/beta hydrolase [Nocardioides marmorisolisilvae]RNL78247.1 alpha/beta hydrolase [Nocardioides marmorisolisilvae]